MSSSTLEEHPTPAQMSPRESYRPDHSCIPSDHWSGKKSNEGQGRRADGYASPPSAPREFSDQDSMKGHDSEVKGHGSSIDFHHSTAHASHDSSLKDFDNDLYGNGGSHHRGYEQEKGVSSSRNDSFYSSVKEFGSDHGSGKRITDIRGSSDCGYGGQCFGDSINNETHQLSDCVSNPTECQMHPSMSWLDRRSFHVGEPCAVPLDWDHHPILRQVPPDEHQKYRHAKLEGWLLTAHKRRSKENFGAYLWRASALATSELKHRKKQCWGDEYGDPLDKFVMRLFYGMKLKLERTESIVLGVDDETDILNILREECEELSKSGELPFDQRSIQFTPLIISEMQERASSGGY